MDSMTRQGILWVIDRFRPVECEISHQIGGTLHGDGTKIGQERRSLQCLRTFWTTSMPGDVLMVSDTSIGSAIPATVFAKSKKKFTD